MKVNDVSGVIRQGTPATTGGGPERAGGVAHRRLSVTARPVPRASAGGGLQGASPAARHASSGPSRPTRGGHGPSSRALPLETTSIRSGPTGAAPLSPRQGASERLEVRYGRVPVLAACGDPGDAGPVDAAGGACGAPGAVGRGAR